jgi:RNA 3'-terminal phosphate cyclase
MISSAREVLNSLIPDVWVYSDLSKNCESPGYGIALMAERFYFKF